MEKKDNKMTNEELAIIAHEIMLKRLQELLSDCRLSPKNVCGKYPVKTNAAGRQ